MKLFNTHGQIKNIYIPLKRNKEGKHFAFIRCKNKDEAYEAIKRLNLYRYNDEILQMNVARFTDERM